VARLPYPDPQALPQRAREALDALPPLNVFRMLANAESAFRPYMRFAGTILTGLELDPLLRELAILQVARASEAQYEWVQHVPIAKASGASDEQIAALERGALDAAVFDRAQQAVVRAADEATRGYEVGEQTFAQLEQLLSPREVVELLLTIGNYRMLATIMRTVKLDLDEPVGSGLLGGSSATERVRAAVDGDAAT
jgi:alkylhydroperoxidase family enzyme